MCATDWCYTSVLCVLEDTFLLWWATLNIVHCPNLASPAIDENKEALDAHKAFQWEGREVGQSLSDALSIEGEQVVHAHNWVVFSAESHVHEVFEKWEALLLVKPYFAFVDKNFPQTRKLVLGQLGCAKLREKIEELHSLCQLILVWEGTSYERLLA